MNGASARQRERERAIDALDRSALARYLCDARVERGPRIAYSSRRAWLTCATRTVGFEMTRVYNPCLQRRSKAIDATLLFYNAS